jgi:hypothetical protein
VTPKGKVEPMASDTPPRLRVAIVADTDSRWKWAVSTAGLLDDPELHYFLIETSATPNERQLREAGVDPSKVSAITIADVPAALARCGADVALVSLPGGGGQAVLHALGASPVPNRPIVVTGYVGVVYEKILEGLLLRAGSDIVLANSPADARAFQQYFREYGADPASIVISPLAYLTHPKQLETNDHPFTVTFAAQPSVPETSRSREYLIRRLVQHARLHPEREVVLKLRGLPGERVTHPEPFPYSKYVAKIKDLPPNFSMVGGPMGTVLARTDLMVTVSSTAAVEAIQAGVATAILTDFGVNDQLGTPYYAGSGCLASFDEIDEGLAPVAHPEWALDNGLIEMNRDAFPAKVAELLAAGPLPPVAPYYTLSRAGFYLPWLLSGYGLTPDGRARSLSRLQKSRIGRRIRRGANDAYRYGVTRVAPLLRKMGAM